MITKKALIGSELLKEIISIRVDAMWRMLALKKMGVMPEATEEGATGYLDNKGAMFIPGGFVLADSDRRPIKRNVPGPFTVESFRAAVREAMRYDNATLIHSDGLASSVTLDNGFFAEMGRHIISIKQAATRRTLSLKDDPPEEFGSQEISRSHSPWYVNPPYGSRTKLSACVAICLMEPRLYYLQCRNFFCLSDGEARNMWEAIRTSRQPVMGEGEAVLAPPYVVVCHTTRYKTGVYGGLTKILGFGQFGEFATFTLEEAGSDVLGELEGGRNDFWPSEIFADYEGVRIVGVLRNYFKTSPGKRRPKCLTRLVAPKDLDIDLARIAREAAERYHLSVPTGEPPFDPPPSVHP